MLKKKNIVLVYDKECPVCHHYCHSLQVREVDRDIAIVNARIESDVMREITERGLDIDQGMVLKVGRKIYYGADAMHELALMSSRVGFFNRANYWLFKSKTVSAIIYPVLRFFRHWLLKILGKSRINNLGMEGNDKF